MFDFLSRNKIEKIKPVQAKKRLDSGEKIVVLDVREKDEFQQGHIPGSINLSSRKIGQLEEMVEDKETILFVYCLTGVRSVGAAKNLVNLGYQNVYNLGGISAWPYEITQEIERVS